jgi:single-stranded-DNA-specific exonuclease
LLAERGVKLVISVDCGISSNKEVAHARGLGLEIIVTDHHEPKGSLPEADVLVHPRLPIGSNGSTTYYPCANLCGAGVAFKLAWALCKKHCNSERVTAPLREVLLDGIMLAALGTVADVVPLFDENRIFVRHGLHRLKQRPSLGLKALLQCAKLEGKSCFDSVDVGYTLAPRINAAGRLGTARRAVELLTTACRDEADRIALELEQHNQDRQALERQILGEARSLAEQDGAGPAFVLSNPAWHPGLLGIVASRLVDQFGRPVLMIATPAGQPHGQGSGRSVPGLALHQALEECTEELLSHGGHAAAAGFRILPERLEAFRARFFEAVTRQLGDKPRGPRIVIDAEAPLAALTSGLVKGIQQMEPYGAGNPPPVLLTGPVQVVGEPKKVGGGERHLSFRVQQQGRSFKAIGFGMAERAEELVSQSGTCSIVFTPRFNEYQGQRWLEIEVKDFRAGSGVPLER